MSQPSFFQITILALLHFKIKKTSTIEKDESVPLK